MIMKNKINMCKLKKGYTKISNKIKYMKLSSNAFVLYYTCMSMPEKFNPSITWLESDTGLSRWVLYRAFKELINKNMIKCIRVGKFHTLSKYEFVKVEEWKV